MVWRNVMVCFFVSYWTVLAAELIGDRSIYTVTSLAMRFRPAVVFAGISAAFLAKMLVAVLCGKLLSDLPPAWTAGISTATFFITALCIWRKKPGPPPFASEVSSVGRSAAVLSFSVVFFSEWVDFGQISAAALAARYNAPLPVWLGGSLALCTKGALALTLGVSLRRRIPLYLVRALSTASCLVLGLIELCDLLRQ